MPVLFQSSSLCSKCSNACSVVMSFRFCSIFISVLFKSFCMASCVFFRVSWLISFGFIFPFFVKIILLFEISND